MKFVRNRWYVAGFSKEFGQELTAQTILNEKLVFFRNQAGEIVALRDRCPHKFLPLSFGRLIGDTLQCGYHGLTFDCSGKCIRIPGQTAVPDNITVERFACAERYGVVWVWMGEKDKADEADIFHMPEFDDPNFFLHLGDPLHLKSNYLNVAENLCDPAHVSFVHPTTLGNPESEDVPINSRLDGETVITHRWVNDAPPVGVFQELADFKGNVDRWHYYYLHAPHIAVIDFGSADVADKIDYEHRGEAVQIYAIHLLTPVNEHYTIDRWLHLRNFKGDDPSVGETMNKLFRIAFDEDKAILEAIQEEELRVGDTSSVKIANDKGSNFYRRLVAKMLAAEGNNNETQAGVH